MKSIDFFLILLAPFLPKRVFKRLKLIEYKKLNALTSIVVILLIGFLIHYSSFQYTSIKTSLVYALGLIANILITGIIISIVSSKTISIKLDLAEGLSIAVTSTLTLISSPILTIVFNISPTFASIIQSLLYSLLICKGLSIFHNIPWQKTKSIGILIIVFKAIIFMSFFGIQL